MESNIIRETVRSFAEKRSELPKIIIIYGPTACGKTSLSVKVAKELGTQIISADSRQIYRGLDIGTGKITQEEMDGIPHHLLDIVDIREDYSVGQYKTAAEGVIAGLHNQGKIPILCGGTGLYIDAIAFNFDIPEIVPDWEYRRELEQIRLAEGNVTIWEMLREIDPEYAKELNPENHRYVIRGLEVFKATGKSKKLLKSRLPDHHEILFLTPYDGNREDLYRKIGIRVEDMFARGLVEELQGLLESGYCKEDFGLNTIGYKEVFGYLEGNQTLEETKLLVKQHNRNYAKRQLTWFRRYAGMPEIGHL